MRQQSLKTRILLSSTAVMLCLILALVVHLGQRQLSQIDDHYYQSLNNLTYSARTKLDQAYLNYDTSNQSAPIEIENRTLLLEALATELLGSKQLSSISILDQNNRVLLHEGDNLGPYQLDITFPDYHPQLIGSGVSTLYVAPFGSRNIGSANNPKLTPVGWLLIEPDNSSYAQQRASAIQQSLGYLVALSALVILLLRHQANQISRPIQDIVASLQYIQAGDLNQKVKPKKTSELVALEEGVNFLAKRLKQTEIEMKLEIKKTTEDLRETLETIEVQNVELDIARKQAVLANRTKSEFLANMSHEIRTPLNGIIGFTNLLLKSSITSRQKEHLSTIRKSSEILLLIINDILDFSKIEAGKLLLERSQLHVRDLIDDVVMMMAPTAHDKNLELVYLHYQDVPETIAGDSLRIKQVITNLVNNAVKFTQAGEVIIRVMLSDGDTGESGEFIKISVSDTGVGLSRAQQHSIFKAFSQADASTARNYGGTGLGLTICKKLIEQMGGEIGFESELGKGSTFWFTLPYSGAKSQEPGAGKLSRDEQFGLRSIKALCFEKPGAPKLAMEHLLNRWGMKYEFARTIDEVFAKITKTTESPFDLVFLSFDKSNLNSHAATMLVDKLSTMGCKTIVFTPTLGDYSSDVLNKVDTHVIKPLTQKRVYNAILELYTETPPIESSQKHTQVRLNSSQTVLVVDDNEINLALVCSLLEQIGIQFHKARDGFEAIRLCEGYDYPVIFMDIQMPGMDGIQTMKKLRNEYEYYSKSYIVALTAYALPEEKESFLAQGFDALLTKPIRETELVETLLGHLPGCSKHLIKDVEIKISEDQAPSEDLVAQVIRNSGDIINFDDAVERCNGNKELALELTSQLLERLPSERELVITAIDNADHAKLEECIHKFHGACQYAGLPKLREAARDAEHGLKTKSHKISEKLSTLISEIDNADDLWQSFHQKT